MVLVPMKLAITIPAYNEEKTISKVISEIPKRIDCIDKIEIIVVDDGSTDNTAMIAEKSGARVVRHQRNQGLAKAFRTALQSAIESGAGIIANTDADFQYNQKQIPLLLKPILDGRADIVLGSRFKGNIEYMPFINKIGNRAFSAVISGITKTKITDAQTGLRAFSQEVAKKVGITSNFTYTQEQIIRAIKLKFKVKEIPVDFARRKDKSRLFGHPFSYAIKAGLTILRIYRDYEPLKFFTFIGGSLFGTGFLIGIWLLYLLFLAFLQT